MLEKKLIKITSKKWAAERMDKAITLNEIELIKNFDIELEEANRKEQQVNTNEDMEQD